MTDARTHRIILNDRPSGYKPDSAVIRKLRLMLPRMKVHGFGPYGSGLWYLLVEDTGLPFNFLGFMSSISINGIPNLLATLATVPEKNKSNSADLSTIK